LSQWWPAPFTADGLVFATAEHYMMWRKATLFGDEAMAERILAAPHRTPPRRSAGRVAGFDQPTWNEHRFDIVVAGNLAKFGEHAELRAACSVSDAGSSSRPARWIGSGASA